jgi:hypothetical protein
MSFVYFCRLRSSMPVSARSVSAICVLALLTCSPAPTNPRTTLSERTERVVKAEDFGTVVSARREDILIVRPPMSAEEWQVAFDETILAPMGTTQSLRRPGVDGWRFKVVGTGDARLTLTPVLPGGANPPSFTVTIRAAS